MMIEKFKYKFYLFEEAKTNIISCLNIKTFFYHKLFIILDKN